MASSLKIGGEKTKKLSIFKFFIFFYFLTFFIFILNETFVSLLILLFQIYDLQEDPKYRALYCPDLQSPYSCRVQQCFVASEERNLTWWTPGGCMEIDRLYRPTGKSRTHLKETLHIILMAIFFRDSQGIKGTQHAAQWSYG